MRVETPPKTLAARVESSTAAATKGNNYNMALRMMMKKKGTVRV